SALVRARSVGGMSIPGAWCHVCFWHKADIPRPARHCPLSGVKRTQARERAPPSAAILGAPGERLAAASLGARLTLRLHDDACGGVGERAGATNPLHRAGSISSTITNVSEGVKTTSRLFLGITSIY